jgi:hypothetical protein
MVGIKTAREIRAPKKIEEKFHFCPNILGTKKTLVLEKLLAV